MIYRIMGKHNGKTQQIDSTSDEQEARTLECEYQIAYGNSWAIWIQYRWNNLK